MARMGMAGRFPALDLGGGSWRRYKRDLWMVADRGILAEEYRFAVPEEEVSC